MKRRTLILLVVLTVFFASSSNAFMEFFGAGPMPVSEGFSAELKALFNSNVRVAAAIGPIVDSRGYYVGDTAQLNAFLKAYSEVPDTRRHVILHAGHLPLDMKKYDNTEKIVRVDWSLHCQEFGSGNKPENFQGKKIYSCLEIWLGGQIDLNKLEVPATLELHSGGEIESFIQKHVEKQKPQNTDK